MTEMMMKPDEGLADRLADVRYSVAVGQVESHARRLRRSGTLTPAACRRG
jgi:hypothetical protein